MVHINSAGTVIGTVPQSCLDTGAGLFGNGGDVKDGILYTLVGDLTAPTADRAVPLDQTTGDTLGDCPFACDSVTDLNPDLTGATFQSSIVLNILAIFVQCRGPDYLQLTTT